MIDLGAYRDPIRRYLRAEEPFPIDLTLTLGVLPKPVKMIGFEYPHEGGANGWHRFEFYIPGIKFVLNVGKGISQDTRNACFVVHPARPSYNGFLRKHVKGCREHVIARPPTTKTLDRTKLGLSRRSGPGIMLGCGFT